MTDEITGELLLLREELSALKAENERLKTSLKWAVNILADQGYNAETLDEITAPLYPAAPEQTEKETL